MTTVRTGCRAGAPAVATLILVGACSGPGDAPQPVTGKGAANSGEAAATVTAAADSYYARVLENVPERAYFAGVTPARHDGLFDNSLAALAEAELFEDQLLESLEAIDIGSLAGRPEWITAAMLLQELRASTRLRVCRLPLWNVNQMGGWQLAYAQLATLQPVGSERERRQALSRWSAFSGFIDTEIENLRAGIAVGYSAPKPVVRRVIEQLDGMLAAGMDSSPFYSPGARSDDAVFSAQMAEVVSGDVNPALARYRAYLENEYLPAARDALSVTANPDGRACYAASLYAYTTLDRAPESVYELGRETVAANLAEVIRRGRAAYDEESLAAIVAAARDDPRDHFDDATELLAFSRDAVERAERAMPEWIGTMPEQPVEVVPFPAHEEDTGRSAHYRPGNDERPAEYRIPLYDAESQSRGNAEATAFHETWPGHHLQVAFAQSIEGLHPVTRLIWFSGPGEGWARYSEALAEEMGLYVTTSGPILRRAWPARGMVVDPGIHLFGWTREQARAYMLESGRFPATQGDDMVDRIAILPGQLTAYDSGALEIFALRREAEARLGDDFDIREFHDRVLENGTIPLGSLRAHVEAWIEAVRGD